MNHLVKRLLVIGGLFLLLATPTASQESMLLGNTQRSRVFATQSADAPPQHLLWQVDGLFRLKFSEERVSPMGSALLFGNFPVFSLSAPLVSDRTIFLSLNNYGDAYLLAIDARTGERIITLNFADNVLCGLAAIGPVAFFGTAKGRVNAYDASSKSLKWSFEEKGTSFCVSDSAIADGVFYISGYNSGVYAFDANTGAVLWRFAFNKRFFGPAVQGDDVIILTEDSLIGIDKKTSTKKWEARVGRLYYGPAILDDQVFVRHIGGEIRAYAVKDGALQWKSNKQGGAKTALVLFHGLVIYGEELGNIVALDARTGAEKWRFKTKKPCRPPIVAGTTVYSRCADHYLYALDADSGTLRWSTEMKSSGLTPAIADGVVYSLNPDGVLQAFR